MSYQPPAPAYQHPGDSRVRPSALCYLVPVLLWIVSLVLFGLTFKAVADLVTDGVDPIRNSASVEVPDDGITVYSTSPTSTCALVTPGGTSTGLETLDGEFELDLPNDPTYFAVGSTPEDLASGTYQLQCSGIRTGELGIGQRLDPIAIGKRVLWGVLLPAFLGFVGLIVLVVLLVKRHNSKSRLKDAQAWSGGYGGGPGYGGTPPGG